ncbi:MAG TPA: DoxX family membrane protein [Roseimicrobium sp.]|nr:DoxX family membrane protein [Roseimicrobium sp.]
MNTDTPPAEAKSCRCRIATTVVRFLLGLPLVVFGLNMFFNFIPQPTTPLPEGAAAFAGALANSGYMMQLIGVTQLVVGVMLVTNRFVPLALALFAPFMVNSIAFHVFLEPSGLIMAGIFMALELYLAWAYRASYRSMLAARVTPT